MLRERILHPTDPIALIPANYTSAAGSSGEQLLAGPSTAPPSHEGHLPNATQHAAELRGGPDPYMRMDASQSGVPYFSNSAAYSGYHTYGDGYGGGSSGLGF